MLIKLDYVPYLKPQPGSIFVLGYQADDDDDDDDGDGDGDDQHHHHDFYCFTRWVRKNTFPQKVTKRGYLEVQLWISWSTSSASWIFRTLHHRKLTWHLKIGAPLPKEIHIGNHPFLGSMLLPKVKQKTTLVACRLMSDKVTTTFLASRWSTTETVSHRLCHFLNWRNWIETILGNVWVPEW